MHCLAGHIPLGPLHEGTYVCMLTAISPEGGPRYFTDNDVDDTQEASRILALEISALIEDSIPLSELESIVYDSLCSSMLARPWDESLAGTSDRDYFDTAVLIGPQNFDWNHELNGRQHRCNDIQLLRVGNYDQPSWAWTQLMTGVYADGEELWDPHDSWHKGIRGCPFFIWERPYRYLEQWFSYGPLELTRATSDDILFSFAEELYWAIDPLRETDYLRPGTLPVLDYGGLEKTYDSGPWWGWQTAFFQNRRSMECTAAAIAEGKRGRALWPCFIEDFQAWQTMQPDI